MGRLKFILIAAVVLAIGIVFGFFLLQNQNDMLIDLLYRSERVEISVGRFALSLFMAGLGTGLLLCFGLSLVQNLEIRSSRREIRKLTTQLEKLRELSLKDVA